MDSSDLRFKNDIHTINGALEKINNLRGVTYTLRTDEYPNKNFSNETQIGWIAQEVEEVSPGKF